MLRKSFVTLALGVGFAMECPAAAEVGGPVENVEGVLHSGTRIDEAAGGFQLVTHGVWTVLGESRELRLPQNVAEDSRVTTAVRRKSSFRRTAYLPHVYAAEARFGLPTGLLDALIWTESRYNPLAISGAGAAWLGQLMPATARELGVANRFDPQASVWGAARYLKQQLDRFRLVHLALAAYNAGPGAVERAGGIPLNGETPGYVRNVLSFWGNK